MPEPKHKYFEWEILDVENDYIVASGITQNQDDAVKEATHYVEQYIEDGEIVLTVSAVERQVLLKQNWQYKGGRPS